MTKKIKIDLNGDFLEYNDHFYGKDNKLNIQYVDIISGEIGSYPVKTWVSFNSGVVTKKLSVLETYELE